MVLSTVIFGSLFGRGGSEQPTQCTPNGSFCVRQFGGCCSGNCVAENEGDFGTCMAKPHGEIAAQCAPDGETCNEVYGLRCCSGLGHCMDENEAHWGTCVANPIGRSVAKSEASP